MKKEAFYIFSVDVDDIVTQHFRTLLPFVSLQRSVDDI